MITLSPVDQHPKRSRNRLSLRLGILLRWSRRSRTKIRGAQKKVVRLWIETHRFGAKLGCDRFDFRELVRGILMKNMNLAIAGRDVQQPCFGFENISVHTSTDGQ